jgi:HD-like signal output (HDOD) protein
VDRLRLLQKGEVVPEGEVAALLKQELHRRRDRSAQAAAGGPELASAEASGPRCGSGTGEESQAAPDAAADLAWVHRRAERTPAAPSDAPSDSTASDATASDATADATTAPDAAADADGLATSRRRSAGSDAAPAPDLGPRPTGQAPTGETPPAQAGLSGDAATDPVARGLPAAAARAGEAQAEADAIVRAWEDAVLGGPVAREEPLVLDGPSATPRDPADILHRSGDLPAMPKAALHILAVIEDPRTTATRLEKAVAMDQALTAKILRIANSPFYGAVREISTVSEAIVRLGFVTIRNWTLVTATKSVFLGAGAGLLFQKIWRQSVLSAMAAQLVAQSVRRAEPETAFVGGLMQNIGQLVLARSQPELFQQVLTVSAEEALPYHVVEQELLGFDHGDLGALLIQEWNLSEDLEQAVRWHHRLDHPDIQCRDLAALVALGEEVAACTGSGEVSASDGEDHWQHSRAAAALGLSPELCRRLGGQAAELTLDPGLFT